MSVFSPLSPAPADAAPVVLADGSVALVRGVFASGRRLVEVVSRSGKGWHRVGDTLVWHPA